ncbi:myosin light chain kinase, putative [Entamoeba invadens IP1]|uniref:myosin light chain kinase, putative n=1 Tax=Entamoeba invadens IP1 TaxID=370355 RepID=UPI0002C3E4B0|nr:myosin light chain kinase, putative [Entamoeba invadens IP1]ELP93388.1 myosin light chain kinase, putative [Entamoeba invadens IP1]|eukprot:XP_004260159.1 myosin light chain kinase, putative [Entamoeba invadens IP1]
MSTKTSTPHITKQKDRNLYSMEGYWDSMDIAKIFSTLEHIDCPYLFPYRNWKYTPPEVDFQGIFKRKVIKGPGVLTFESDVVTYTLQDFLDEQPNHTLNGDKAMSVISQVWIALNSIRNLSPFVRVLSLHPSNVVLTVLPGSNPPTHQIQIQGYIPLIFFDSMTDDMKMYCSPLQLSFIHKKLNVYDPRCDMYTFALLVTKIWTDKLPYRSEVNITNLFDANGIIFRLPLFPNPLVKTLVEMILIKNMPWEYTYTDDYLVMARKATFLEFRSKPEDFKVIEEIGKGTSATVYQAIQKTRRGDRIVAIKEMIVNNDEMQFIQNEVDIMSLCRHPNVIQMYDSFTHQGSIFTSNPAFFANIIIEFCDGGTLQNFFESEFPVNPFPDYLIAHVLKGILSGLFYLHSEHHIVHRDLKPENILLKVDPANTNAPIVKIADFGLSKIVENRQMMESYVGTPVFMAPEVFKMQKYDYKCDLWSLGGLLYFLRTHVYPLSSNRQRFMANMQNQIPPAYQDAFWSSMPGLKDLVSNLIVYDQNRRYDWAEIHKHQYVKTIMGDALHTRDYDKL